MHSMGIYLKGIVHHCRIPLCFNAFKKEKLFIPVNRKQINSLNRNGF